MTQSLKVAGPSLLRRYAWSSGVDDLADLRQFQLEEDDYDVRSSDLPGELSSVQTADSQPFEQIPGPRGLPLIGNMLSYSKLGKLTSFIAFVSTTILLHSSLFIFFLSLFSSFRSPDACRQTFCFAAVLYFVLLYEHEDSNKATGMFGEPPSSLVFGPLVRFVQK